MVGCRFDVKVWNWQSDKRLVIEHVEVVSDGITLGVVVMLNSYVVIIEPVRHPLTTDQKCLHILLSVVHDPRAVCLHVTRNSSGDGIANVNFFTTTSSTTMQHVPEATEFGEMTQI